MAQELLLPDVVNYTALPRNVQTGPLTLLGVTAGNKFGSQAAGPIRRPTVADARASHLAGPGGTKPGQSGARTQGGRWSRQEPAIGAGSRPGPTLLYHVVPRRRPAAARSRLPADPGFPIFPRMGQARPASFPQHLPFEFGDPGGAAARPAPTPG